MRALTSLIAIISICLLAGCHPRIYQFRATPATSTGKDSIRLDWKIRGQASILYTQRRIAQPPNDSVTILEFKLIVQKWGIDSFRTIQVPVVPDLSEDKVVFSVTRLAGDTLVASGIKDTVRWAGFVVDKIVAPAGKTFTITHAGIIGILAGSKGSDVWKGMPYAGYWQIKTALTDAEKNNHASIPDRLALTVTIKSK